MLAYHFPEWEVLESLESAEIAYVVVMVTSGMVYGDLLLIDLLEVRVKNECSLHTDCTGCFISQFTEYLYVLEANYNSILFIL